MYLQSLFAASALGTAGMVKKCWFCFYERIPFLLCIQSQVLWAGFFAIEMVQDAKFIP